MRWASASQPELAEIFQLLGRFWTNAGLHVFLTYQVLDEVQQGFGDASDLSHSLAGMYVP